MKQIIVNVSGLTIEEKQRVNEALAKITGFNKMTSNIDKASWMYAPSSYDYNQITYINGNKSHSDKEPTHTPQQVLEMAGMTKQGHVHADLMALYAEDAKTTDKPWELWQIKAGSSDWISCKFSPSWDPCCQFRRKPKTKLIHGVEVPDISFTPNDGEEYVYPDIYGEHYASANRFYSGYDASEMALKAGCCYPYTEEGTQAAILHAKAWLGLHPDQLGKPNDPNS